MLAPHEGSKPTAELRLSELLSALSYALDMVEGQPPDHCVRCCWIGIHIAREIDLPESEIWELLSNDSSIPHLVFSLILVMAFEATNGFHDAANAVATVIYTKSLMPLQAVIWSGVMNFLGVLIGGITVAYALVELLPIGWAIPPCVDFFALVRSAFSFGSP